MPKPLIGTLPQTSGEMRGKMISFDCFTLTDGSPIYLQIIQYIKRGIAAGSIGNQEEIPSRRALSALLGVNPNTIQKAYHMLEDEGIIISRPGAKSYTCADEKTVERIRAQLLYADTRQWVDAMRQLDVTRESAFALAGDIWAESMDNEKSM